MNNNTTAAHKTEDAFDRGYAEALSDIAYLLSQENGEKAVRAWVVAKLSGR